MTAIREENLLAVIVKGSLLLLLIFTLVGFIVFSTQTGLGILTGGSIAIINFIWMRSVIQRILGAPPAKPQLYSQIRFIARLGVTGCVLYFVITSGLVSLAGLLIGLSIIVFNIIILSLYCALRTGG